MPAATVTCPHCEKSVEIQVTAVTRSRPCPDCGQSIMLQVAGRASQMKHKALLMSATPPTDHLPKPDFIDEASCFPGDAFERMCLDPELIRTRKQLILGAAAVCVLAVIMAVLKFADPWQNVKLETTQVAVAESSSKPRAMPTAPVPLIQHPQASTNGLKRITFRAASGDTVNAASDEPQTALEKFLAAGSVDEKLALVHDAVRVESALRSYYQSHQTGALPYSHIERHPSSSGSFTEFRVVLRDGTKKFAAVVPTPDGPRVDWASFVALGDLEWEQMRQARPARPVLMRVLAQQARQFTGSFSNERRLRCVRLVPAADPTASPVYGYVPLESELGRQLGVWLNAGDQEAVPLTVKICYPQETITHDQAWISEVVVPGWVTMAAKSSEEGE